jgi:hypothetical protein
MDAGWFRFLGFLRSKNPMPQNDMDGRQEAGWFQCLEFARSANSERRKNGMEAVFSPAQGIGGVRSSHGAERRGRSEAEPRIARSPARRAGDAPKGLLGVPGGVDALGVYDVG